MSKAQSATPGSSLNLGYKRAPTDLKKRFQVEERRCAWRSPRLARSKSPALALAGLALAVLALSLAITLEFLLRGPIVRGVVVGTRVRGTVLLLLTLRVLLHAAVVVRCLFLRRFLGYLCLCLNLLGRLLLGLFVLHILLLLGLEVVLVDRSLRRRGRHLRGGLDLGCLLHLLRRRRLFLGLLVLHLLLLVFVLEVGVVVLHGLGPLLLGLGLSLGHRWRDLGGGLLLRRRRGDDLRRGLWRRRLAGDLSMFRGLLVHLVVHLVGLEIPREMDCGFAFHHELRVTGVQEQIQGTEFLATLTEAC